MATITSISPAVKYAGDIITVLGTNLNEITRVVFGTPYYPADSIWDSVNQVWTASVPQNVDIPFTVNGAGTSLQFTFPNFLNNQQHAMVLTTGTVNFNYTEQYGPIVVNSLTTVANDTDPNKNDLIVVGKGMTNVTSYGFNGVDYGNLAPGTGAIRDANGTSIRILGVNGLNGTFNLFDRGFNFNTYVGTPNYPFLAPMTYNHPTTFTFDAPVITTFTPVQGAAGWEITVTGKNLISAGAQANDVYKINGVTAQYKVIETDTKIRNRVKFTIPVSTSGKITITNPFGTATSATDFIYAVPSITSFSPSTGAAGTSVVINGTYFSNGTGGIPVVKFNGVACTTISNLTQTSMTVVVPTSTTGKITVTTPNGTATSATDYVYPAIPITVTKSTSGIFGGSVSNVLYSKNGGAFTAMPATLSILATDVMQYRATFNKASTGTGVIGTISSSSSVNLRTSIQGSSPLTLTLNVPAINANYTMMFKAESVGSGGPSHS